MILEVRPTPALQRHRTRIAGAVTGLLLLGVSLASVAELANAAQPSPGGTTVSDSARR
jgi:hypothetical protein